MRTLHGWLAFLFAIPLVLASLSGAMLGFARESDRMFNVDLLSAPMSSAPLQSVDTLFNAAQAAFPASRIIGMAPATTPVDATLILMVDADGHRHEVYLHPRTGELRGYRSINDSFFGLAHALHTRLFINDAGRWLIRFAALGLLLTALSGVLLGTRTQSRGMAARIHPLLGMTSAPVLALIGASGLAFLAWQPGYGNIQRMALTAQPASVELHSPQTALEAMRNTYPDHTPRWISAIDNERMVLICDTPNHAGTLGTHTVEWHGEHGLRFDTNATGIDQAPATGELLYNLHTGELLGMPGRILWVMASLAVPFLILGGFASRKARLKHAHHE